jgi:putative ABC transport system permease protein
MRDDLRAAARTLISAPAVTAAALVVLTLGIGAGTAIFSVVDAVVLRGLPFDESDRIVAIGERGVQVNPADPEALLPVAPQNYLDWRARQRAFASIAAIASGWLTLQEPGGVPESLIPQRVTASFFDVLRVRPALGRPFTVDNETEGRQQVAVLSDGLWRRRFGADPTIVGRTIRLQEIQGGGNTYEVVGVMPRDFTYPVGASRPTDIWIPYVVPASQRLRDEGAFLRYLQVVARLAPGVSPSQAQQQMNAIATALEHEHPKWNKDSRIGVRPLVDHIVGASMRSWMLMLLGAVALVLVIACANVASLLLARSASRAREMSIRAALGAGRGRLVRQLLLESLLLSGLATAAALLFGWWAVGALRNALPPNVPRVAAIALNLRVLAAAAAAAGVTGLLFGAMPALQLSRPDLARTLRDGAHATPGRRKRRLGAALVIGEIALAVVLLVGAALFIASFASVLRIEPGFNPEHVLTAQYAPTVERLPDGGYADRRAGLLEVADRIGHVPGVTAAAMVDGGLPFGGATTMGSVRTADGMEMINIRRVTADYQRAIGVPLRAGRFFTSADQAGAAKVIVLNESAARHFFPDRDAIGGVLSMGDDRTVVGVVGDIHQRSLETQPWREVYVPLTQVSRPVTAAEMAIRTAGDPLVLAPAIAAAARTVYPDVPLRNVIPMQDMIARQLAQRRLNMMLLGLFGLLGLAIAAVGLYAVISHAVSQRRMEIGIRVALGATRGRVLAMIMRDALRLVVTGLALGTVAAWYLSALAGSFLFQVRPTDPRAFAAAVGVLTASALLASLLPARRAAGVDPIVALR